MKPSRRAFLGAAATVPAVAAVAAIPAVAIQPVVAAPPAPLPPRPFQWWFSYDGETYVEWFKTKEAALAYLNAEGDGLIAECQQQDFALDISGYEILELLEGQNSDAIGEGEFISCTREQENDLGRMVSDAIEAWVRKHKIDTTAWTFGEVRNRTKFERPQCGG